MDIKGMKLKCTNENWNKINSKEELDVFLKKYNNMLSDSIISYLNSLLNLEISVIRDYIKAEDRITLSELEIYKRIAIYNIYNRALSLFKENKLGLTITSKNSGILGKEIYALSGEKQYRVFEYNYIGGDIRFEGNISRENNPVIIGNISLFQTVESKGQNGIELQKLRSELDKLHHEKNPYRHIPIRYGGAAPWWTQEQRYGGSDSLWSLEENRKIVECERKIKLLDSKRDLTDEEKEEIEITKEFNELILKDYGLTDKDFEDKNKNKFVVYGEKKIELHKKLVKNKSGIDIKNNIKYI